MVKNYPDSQLIDCTPSTSDLTCIVNQEQGALKKKILVEGTGESVAENGQEVTFNYECSYQNGTPVDSSYKRGRPLSIVLGKRLIDESLKFKLKSFFQPYR